MENKRSILYIVLTAFCFGTMEVASKVGGASFDSIQLVFLRFIIGGIILLPFAIHDLKKKQYRLSGSDMIYLLALGVVCVCISMALFQIGVKRINANLASVIISMNPLFTMIFAKFIVGEPFTKKKALVLAISFFGLIIVLNPMTLVGDSSDVTGILITIIAAVAFGLYTAMGKKRIGRLGGMVENAVSFLLGSAVLLVFMVITGTPVLKGVNMDTLPVLLYLGICVTGIGYYCFLKAVEISGASNASIAFFIKPVVAPIVAWIVLQEAITWNFILGVIVILIGSYINMKPDNKR